MATAFSAKSLALGVGLALSGGALAGEPALWVHAEPGQQAQETLHLADVTAAMHGVFTIGGISRGSEMGHDNYRPELAGDPMARRGQQWLELARVALAYQEDDGLAGSLERVEGDLRPVDSADNTTLASLAYSHHMHHRAGRWSDHDLYDAITYEPVGLITLAGRQVLDNLYADGTIHSDPTQAQWDRTSLSQGLSALHGHVYAWVRWHKPGGADDMGVVSEERLTVHLGYAAEEMLAPARALAATLDGAWDEAAGGYDFGDGTETGLADLGALLRGHKALYELLYIFGDEDDKKAARTLFDRAAQQVEAVAGLAAPAGLPERLRFRDGRAEAVTDEVDLHAQWRYVMELTSGFGLTREREGTSEFIGRYRPETAEAVGGMVDTLLKGTLEHAVVEGRLVSRLGYDDGRVVDDRTHVRALGYFLVGAGNAYRAGQAFERASDWDDAEEAVVARSRQLYDTLVSQAELLDRAIAPRQ